MILCFKTGFIHLWRVIRVLSEGQDASACGSVNDRYVSEESILNLNADKGNGSKKQKQLNIAWNKLYQEEVGSFNPPCKGLTYASRGHNFPSTSWVIPPQQDAETNTKVAAVQLHLLFGSHA